MIERQEYVICWKSELTGNTGRGTGHFSHARAQEICDALNKQDKGVLIHWIEAVPPEWTVEDILRREG